MANERLSIVERLSETDRRELLRIDDARTSTVYGALSLFSIFGPSHVTLKKACLVQTFIPAGGMGIMTKVTPKGRKVAASLRERSA
jgi:hypothetical protein